MDHLDQHAIRLLAGVPGNACVFCRHIIGADECRAVNFNVLGRDFSCCEGCVGKATDFKGRVPQEEEIRDEFIQAQTLQCYVCRNPGATVICSNVKHCGNKFHWSCRHDEEDDDLGCSKCSKCAGKSEA